MFTRKVRPLITFELNGHHYQFCGNDFGKEIMQVDGETVFQRRGFRYKSSFTFACPYNGNLLFRFDMNTTNFDVQYSVEADGQVLLQGECSYAHLMPKWAQATATTPMQVEADEPQRPKVPDSRLRQFIKRPSTIKATLAIVALVGWSWLFDIEFAFAIIICILIHEYGHIFAMRRAGLEVKGVYLLPFLGGVAISDRMKTSWQAFQVFIAGPAVGTLGAVVTWLLWLQTDYDFFAILTILGLVINLINLVPIVPFDGGQVLKAAIFSLTSKVAKYAMLLLNAGLVASAFFFGFTLIGILGVLGLIDLIAASRTDKPTYEPMNNTGIVVTLGSYLGLIGLILWLSTKMAATGLPGADLLSLF